MAANGAVITEFQETPRGAAPVKRTTLAPTVSTAVATHGTVLGPNSTHKSDGQKRTIGEG